jgi:hypothetical protein
MLVLAALALLGARVFLSPDPATNTLGWLWASVKGPGAAHASLLISLAGGLLIGVLAQRSRFCTMGALRDLFLFRQMHLFSGVLAFLVIAFAANLALGQFHPGFEGQPIAHTASLWNFLGMVVAGLAFALAGGCPGRQLILAGEGDGDSAVFVLGMLVAAALAHNMGWASSPAGIGPNGAAATFVALGFCLLVGVMNLKKA